MIRVMIVDDSAVVRQVASEVLGKQPDITVIAVAADPIIAHEKMQKDWPDVLVMDVEMPRMDGITFLRQLMSERPTPVVICSSLTQQGAETTMQAIEAGAVSIVAKPTMGVKDFLLGSGHALVDAVREAAAVNVSRLVPSRARAAAGKFSADVVMPRATPQTAMAQTTEQIVAIGTSTGGTQALEVVLAALPSNCPGIVIVQHMPERFTAAFADRLNRICEIEVREAKSNDRIIPGRALLAPGGKHLAVKRSGAFYFVEVIEGPPVNRHCPSVDVLFRSVAKCAGRNATGVIMTGMGDDGARGLKEMRDAGARTIAQDEDTCVVFGMPKEAIKMGAVAEIVPLGAISEKIKR